MIGNTNSIVQLAIQIKNEIMNHVNVNVKIIVRAKKIITEIRAHVFVRTVSLLKVLLKIQKLCVMKLYMIWILHQQM